METHVRRVLALIILFSAFAGAVVLMAPAVDDNEHGILTAIDVQVAPGNGELVLRLRSTTVNSDTQDSMQTAFAEAAKLAERNYDSYDYTVRFDSALGKVNGPSAGAALTIMAYSEFTGKKIRDGFIITGTITKGGAIGAVGGVKAKIDAVGSNKSYKVMLVPAGQTTESGESILDSLYYADYAMQKYNLTVVPVSNVSYAIKIATGEIEPPAQANTTDFIPREYLASNSSWPFYATAQGTIDESESRGRGSTLSDLQKKAFERLLAESKLQLSLGYYYSAANTAFLVKNAVSTEEFKNMSIAQFHKVADNFQDELSAMTFPQPNSTNWEWVATSQMRYTWARLRTEKIQATLHSNESIGNSTLAWMANDLSAAMGWLDAARMLNAGSTPRENAQNLMPQDKAKMEAEKYIKLIGDAVNETAPLDTEIATHLNSSKELYDQGWYYAAMLDASYSYAYIAAERALVDRISKSDDALEESSLYAAGVMNEVNAYPSFADRTTRSGWADLFYAHAYYNYQRGKQNSEYGSNVNALKLAALADAFQRVRDFAYGEAFVLPSNVSNVSLGPLTDQPAAPTLPGTATQTVIVIGQDGEEENSTANNTSINTTISVRPDGNPSSMVLFGAFLLLLLLAGVLIAYLVGRRKAVRSQSELDVLYSTGKLSRKRYEALSAKYFPKKPDPQPSASHWSEEVSAPPVRLNSKKAIALPPAAPKKRRLYRKAP